MKIIYTATRKTAKNDYPHAYKIVRTMFNGYAVFFSAESYKTWMGQK